MALSLGTGIYTNGAESSANHSHIASKTWTNGHVFFLGVNCLGDEGANPATEPTVSDGALNWTNIGTYRYAVGDMRATLFRLVGDGSTSAPIIDFAGVTQVRVLWAVADGDGLNATTPVVASSFKSAYYAGAGNNTPTVTLNAFADATNNGLLLWVMSTYQTSAAPEAGITELFDDLGNSSRFGWMGWRLGEDTTPSCTLAANATSWIALGCELAAAASGNHPRVSAFALQQMSQ